MSLRCIFLPKVKTKNNVCSPRHRHGQVPHRSACQNRITPLDSPALFFSGTSVTNPKPLHYAARGYTPGPEHKRNFCDTSILLFLSCPTKLVLQ